MEKDEVFEKVHTALMKHVIDVDAYSGPALAKLNQAATLPELTDWVRDQSWDVESWVEFILEATLGLATTVEVGPLAGFST